MPFATNPTHPARHASGQRRWRLCGLLLASGVATATLQAAPPEPAPREPTVTRAEAALLERVHEIAATNTTAAIAWLTAAQRPSGPSAALDFVLGNLNFQAQAYDAAAAAYRTAIGQLPTFANAHRNLGRTLLLLDRPMDAAEALLAVLRIDTPDADTWALLGHAYVLADRPVSGEAAYRQALLLNADHREASRGLVKVLIRQARFNEAGALATELLNREPRDAELWALRGNAALARGDEREAIATFETAARLSTLTVAQRLLLGDLYINQRRPADALRHYRHALEREPAPKHVLHAAEAFLLLGDTARAGDLLKGLSATPDSPEDLRRAGLLRARLALLDNQAAQARDAVEAVLSANPLDGEALLLQGEIAETLTEPDAAALAYERAARVDGFRVRALLAQGRLEAGRGAYARAIEHLAAAQVLEPRPDVARYIEQLRRLVALTDQAVRR
jgi:tetratricopeptide (TPR) repeat protein